MTGRRPLPRIIWKIIAEFWHNCHLQFSCHQLFHTIEGGAVITNIRRIMNMSPSCCGSVTTMTIISSWDQCQEFRTTCAMGLCNLKYVPDIISGRKAVSEAYDRSLPVSSAAVPPARLEYNYAYYPSYLKRGGSASVKEASIRNRFSRAVFFPSLNLLPYIPEEQACPYPKMLPPGY